MPDWGKMNFREYPGKAWEDILFRAEHDAVELVSRLVVFGSSRRLTANEVLGHTYLR